MFINTDFSRMKRSWRAFTLVELLVVIAILGILAALLFPVFSRARENGRRASCQSNLKQIGLGLLQYSQDFDEILVADWHGSTAADGTDKTQPLSSATVSYKWMDAAFPYIKNEQVFNCPSAQGRAARPYRYYKNLSAETEDYGSYTITHGYGANNSVRTPPVSHPLLDDLVNLSQVADAPRTVWISDGNGDFYSSVTVNGVNNVLERHLEMTNVLFLDGHVKAVTLDRINRYDSTGTFLPAVTIQLD